IGKIRIWSGGTDNLSLVYKINQQTGADKSKVVTLRGIEPRLPP
ncbi:MAG: hypothetical protein QG609_376, partial [Patescibacteria group bacterium]|nr:hypothetical protein [Patescibacteria group bacterium]